MKTLEEEEILSNDALWKLSIKFCNLNKTKELTRTEIAKLTETDVCNIYLSIFLNFLKEKGILIPTKTIGKSQFMNLSVKKLAKYMRNHENFKRAEVIITKSNFLGIGTDY